MQVNMKQLLPQLMAMSTKNEINVRSIGINAIKVFIDKEWVGSNYYYYCSLYITQFRTGYKISDHGELAKRCNQKYGKGAFKYAEFCLPKAISHSHHYFKHGIYNNMCDSLSELIMSIDEYCSISTLMIGLAFNPARYQKSHFQASGMPSNISQEASQSSSSSLSASSYTASKTNRLSLKSSMSSKSSNSQFANLYGTPSNNETPFGSISASDSNSSKSPQSSDSQFADIYGSQSNSETPFGPLSSRSSNDSAKSSQSNEDNSSSSASSLSSQPSSESSSATLDDVIKSKMDPNYDGLTKENGKHIKTGTSRTIDWNKDIAYRTTPVEPKTGLEAKGIKYAKQSRVESSQQLASHFDISADKAKKLYRFLNNNGLTFKYSKMKARAITYAERHQVNTIGQLQKHFHVAQPQAKDLYTSLDKEGLVMGPITFKKRAIDYAKKNQVRTLKQLCDHFKINYQKAKRLFSFLAKHDLVFSMSWVKKDSINYAKNNSVKTLTQLMKHYHINYPKAKPIFDNLNKNGLISK